MRVWVEDHRLTIEVEDKGKGFDPQAAMVANLTSGLAGMRERAQLLGGRLTIESRLGAGTRLTAELEIGEERL